MSISTVITSALAGFLGVPRKYAVGTPDGTWSRVHEDLTVEDFHRRLTTEPLCVAIKNSNHQPGVTGYREGQLFVVFDVDAEDDFEGAKAAALNLADGLMAEGIPFLVTFSGKKGFHVWVFFDAEISCDNARVWQVQFLTHLGYAFVSANHYGKSFNNGPMIDVDILHAAGMGYVVKVPFSRHQSRTGFYEIPVAVADISGYDKNTPPTDTQWTHAISVFEHVQQADAILVLMALPPSTELQTEIQNIQPTRRGSNERWCYTVPERSDQNDQRNAEIVRVINAVPCIKEIFRRCVELDHIYTERTYLVKFLKKKNFERNEILYFIRWKVNDEEDNAHPYKLIYYTNYWYDNRYRPNSNETVNLCRCSKIQDELHACFAECGRRDPSSREPPYRIPRADWQNETLPLGVRFDAFLASPTEFNLEAFAATRSRKTTEAVMSTIRAGKKSVVLVPRLSIAEQTGARILELAAAAGHQVYSCMIPDNRQICLVRLREAKQQYEIHAIPEGCVSAFDQLPHVDKPSCAACAYRLAHEPEIEPNRIYGKADDEREICGYQTILAHADKWNLVWMSNAKFTSVSEFQDVHWQTPVNGILSNAQVFILDEVGDMIQTPAFEMPLYWITTEESPFEFWFLRNLNEEIRLLTAYFNNQRMTINRGRGVLRRDSTDAEPVQEHNRIRITNELATRLGEEIGINVERIKTNPEDGTFKYRRDISPHELEEIKRASRLIAKSTISIAKDDNIALTELQNLLSLGQELEWIFTNVPTEDYSIRISVLIAPKVSGYVDLIQSGSAEGVKILALDAVPPIVSLDDVFERPFVKVNFGDPMHTNDKYLIIPDSKVVTASGLIDSTEDARRLRNTLMWSDRLVGDSNVGVLATSKKQADWIKGVVFELNELDILHHRGSRTMGVEYQRRFGVSVCAPNPPKDSNHWLKLVYEDALRNVSPTQLQRHDQARQTMQAEGRFKDPQDLIFSVVFAFGQSRDMVKESYLNSIAPPRIAKTIRSQPGGLENECPIQLVQATLWIRTQQLIENAEELNTITRIMRGQDDRTIQNGSRTSVSRIRELRDLLERNLPEVLLRDV